MSEPIARYYDESKNPSRDPNNLAMLVGVPLRDLTETEYGALPPWLQASVDASPMYRKTRPRRTTASDEPETLPAPMEE